MGATLSKPIAKERNLYHDEFVDRIRYTTLENKPSSENNEPEYWGYITSGEDMVPDDPQLFASGTPDPYAPFAFNQGIQWESYYYDDGSIYEGTMTENFPHGKGVLSIGYIGGGGLQSGANSLEMQFGDIYEGEFNLGFAHGMGKYINLDGCVYLGEFMAGMKHGCGQLTDLSPYLKLVQSGTDPVDAWQTSAQNVTRYTGTWRNDRLDKGPDMEYTGASCTPIEIAVVIEDAEKVSNKARMYRYKPDGMAQIFYQDSKGIPVRTLQDPLHYPYGTSYLAPGPLAQLYPIPADDDLNDEMFRAQNLWRSIYDEYNFNTDPRGNFSYAMEMWAEAKFLEQQKREKIRELEQELAKHPM